MAIIQAVNILSGAVEGIKYTPTGTIDEIWQATLTTGLSNADVIIGPSIPSGCYLVGLTVDCTSLDSSTGITFEAGYSGHLAAFIVGSTVGQGGGIQGANVGGAIGFTPTTAQNLIRVTITHVATTPVQGVMTIKLSYTANP